MQKTVYELQDGLDRASDLLSSGALFAIGPKVKERLETRAQLLRQKLEYIEGSFLNIGLLGGTGVGKSTLMNALAGLKIASTSHRRPHTDRILIYRHWETSPPFTDRLADVPWEQFEHQADEIRSILLCDLPDFDSISADHRKHVLNFLECLDILVWVATPEKYADKQLYDFLQMVPKSEQNFCFVLNKTDIYFEGEIRSNGYDRLERALKRFQQLIEKSGIEAPVVFTISAKEALESEFASVWNQFRSLRQQIFQQRDSKQILTLKGANLDVEIQQFLDVFGKELAQLEAFEQIIADTAAEFKEERAAWVQTGREAIEAWLRQEIEPLLRDSVQKPSLLVGPGYGIALLLQKSGPGGRQQESTPEYFRILSIPANILLILKRHLEWLQDRLVRRIRQRNLADSLRRQVQTLVAADELLKDLQNRLTQAATLNLAGSGGTRLWGFKGIQMITYFFLWVCFIAAVGGASAWRATWETPGLQSIFQLILAGLGTLFSSKGLAALASFGILNIYLGVRFYQRYLRRLQKRSQRRVTVLQAELLKIWKDELAQMDAKFEGLLSEVRTRSLRISEMITPKQQGK